MCPALDVIVMETCENFADLFIPGDIFAFEETQTCIFVSTHDSRSKVARVEDGNSRWRVLLDRSEF
jgi:hypothetical protein